LHLQGLGFDTKQHRKKNQFIQLQKQHDKKLGKKSGSLKLEKGNICFKRTKVDRISLNNHGLLRKLVFLFRRIK
jgi:hypothetical protein